MKGTARDIGTIGAFYQSNLDLVKEKPNFSFYDKDAPIYTMSRFLPRQRSTCAAAPELQACEACCSHMLACVAAVPAAAAVPFVQQRVLGSAMAQVLPHGTFRHALAVRSSRTAAAAGAVLMLHATNAGRNYRVLDDW